ncbi:MAG: hypothetical protein WCA22_18810 [Candidatus Binatus sp.]
MATFTLSPPTGLSLATVYQGASGATYTPSAGGYLVINDEKDVRAFLEHGWVAASVAGE